MLIMERIDGKLKMQFKGDEDAFLNSKILY